MKKFNKVLSVVVASAMVMAMAGCGNTDNGSAATGTNAATESAAADNGAASGSVFKIGGIGPTPVAQQFMDWLYSMVQRSQ